jgi:hypothetical protein
MTDDIALPLHLYLIKNNFVEGGADVVGIVEQDEIAK